MYKKKDVPSGVSFIYGVCFILLLSGLFVSVYFIENVLPEPLKFQDEEDDLDNRKFIAESAKEYLKGLTEIGPRVVGSDENEILAVDYLKGIINGIIRDKHPNQNIELDHQVTSGSYYLAYKPYGSINAYANLQNLVVKVHSSVQGSNKSILVNAHYDTMTTSPGGSDDGINCAVMLEILRQLSKLRTPRLHNIIFLFNGGEESNLQASHGFITQHKWAKEAKVVVNLEAVGAGGKEILFQAGPEQGWLMEYYSRVPHPFTHLLAEEIFKSNIIPSDSDFRIFRDFRGLIGYDFAYIKDGYRYHTKYDGFDNIEDGRYQRTGDNILTLLLDLSQSDEITDGVAEVGGAVYFDVFGLLVLHYGRTAELTLNIVVAILSIATVIWCLIDFRAGCSLKSYLLIFFKIIEIIIEWLTSAVLVLLLALLLGGVDKTMSWYKIPYIAIGLYSVPTLLACCGVLLLVNRFLRKDSRSIQEDVILHSHLTRLIWTVVLLLCRWFFIRSVYLLVIPTIFNMVTSWIIHGFRMHRKTSWWVFVYVIGNLFPTMFFYGLSYHILGLVIPICGRFGTELNPEFIVGLCTMFLTIISLCYYIPLILLIKSPVNILICLLSCFIASFIIMLTPVGFPYSGNLNELAPQRFSIFHTQRTFRGADGEVIKADAGFHFLPMDYNSPRSVIPYVKELENILSLEDDCRDFLFCGLPVVDSKDFEELHKSVWVPTEPPQFIHDVPKMQYSITTISDTVIRYQFEISGPDCMDIYLSPKGGIHFDRTDLNDYIPNEQPFWNERPTLYVLYVYGKEAAPLKFYVDFAVPKKWNQPVLDIAITGKYLHENVNDVTSHYQKFLSQFPEFAIINLKALGYYESWVI